MNSVFLVLLLIFSSTGIQPWRTLNNDDQKGYEGLIVVLDQEEPLDQKFQKEILPSIKSYAEENNIEISILDFHTGSPAIISFTPMIIFQNERGRSYFTGRYNAIDKIRNFIRTSKVVAQKELSISKDELPVLKTGRMTVAAPIKITTPEGVLPPDFDKERFLKIAKAGLKSGLTTMSWQQSMELKRTDRSFYFDLYPYFSENGEQFLSIAIFSQFNCIEPVFVSYDNPLKGDLSSTEVLFARAAALFEIKLDSLIKDPLSGDGFTAVHSNDSVLSFDQMGFSLPQKEKNEVFGNDLNIDLMERTWELKGPIADDIPLVQFNFPAPLEHYSGESYAANGTVNINTDQNEVNGLFKVFASSLTMGDPGLDKAVKEKMIHADEFPQVELELRGIRIINGELEWGQSLQCKIPATFRMIGKTTDLEVTAMFEPSLDDLGQPNLQVEAFFQIPLSDIFGIEGPPGPPESSNFLNFNINLLLK